MVASGAWILYGASGHLAGPAGTAAGSGSGSARLTADAGPGAPTVLDTLVLSTNTLVAGNDQSTIVAGYTPKGIAYDSLNGEIFVANGTTSNVTVISGATNLVVGQLPVGAEPGAIVYDPGSNELFVANSGSATVSVFALTADTESNISVGVGPDGLAYDSANGYVYVANEFSDSVSVISDNLVINTIAITGGPSPNGQTPSSAVYSSAANEVFVTEATGDNVTVISGTSVVQTIPVGSAPYGSVYDSGTGQVFVMNYFSSNVSVIAGSGTTNAVVATITGGANPASAAYDSVTGEIFVAEDPYPTGSGTFPGAVEVLSDATDQFVATVLVGAGPEFAAYDPGSGLIYVGNSVQGTISILACPISISSFVASPSATDVGTPATLTVTASAGSRVLAYHYTGLPSGCSTGNVTSLSCTPSTSRSSPFTVKVFANGTGLADHLSASATTSLTVNPVPTVSTFAATPATVALGGSTSFAVSASGGTGTLSYDYTGLPAGCYSFDVTSLPCTPASAGSFSVEVFVNDTLGVSAHATTPLTVSGAAVPLVVSSFGASPNTLTLGGTSTFAVATTGGSGAFSYAYTGLPSGCTTANATSLSCTPTATGSSTVKVFVNDTQGVSASATTVLTVSPVPVLTSVSVNPSSVTLLAGSQAGFTATPSCGASSCPSGTAYLWTLTNELGTVSSTTGASVLFTAGSTAGSVTLFVNATLNAVTEQSTGVSITITAPSAPSLSSVILSATSPSISTGGTVDLTASAVCSGGTCPTGVTYAWTLSSTLGTLNSSTGTATAFKAGSQSGSVVLTVTATLNGASTSSSSTVTVTSPPSSSSSTSPSAVLGSATGLVLLGLLVVMVIGFAVLFWRTRPRSPSPPRNGTP